MVGVVSRLALRGVEPGLDDENLELKLEKNDPRLPCWCLVSFSGPLLLPTSALGRLAKPGRLLLALGASAEVVAVGKGEASDVGCAPAPGAALETSTSVVLGVKAGFSVGGATLAGIGV